MSQFPETRHSLIARVRELGDGESWDEFLQIYQPVVHRMALRRGLQDADAQDVVQQVFLSISRSIESWKTGSGAPFRAWLTTITRNAILKALTRRPRDCAAGSSSVLQFLHEVPEDESVSQFQFEARREIVYRAADQIRNEFAAETWQIFWDTAVNGVAIADVARLMQRTPGSIYVARYRVLARLKAAVLKMTQEWGLQEGVSP